MNTKRALLLVFLLLWTFSYAQHHKLKVQEEDYKKWSVLSGEKLSPDAKWATYSNIYESGLDTLYLQNVKTGNRRFFADGSFLNFSSNNKWFTVRMRNNDLYFSDINGSKENLIPMVDQADFTEDGRYLLVQNTVNGKTVLRIFSGVDALETRLNDVTSYEMGPSHKIAVINKDGVGYYDLQKGFDLTMVVRDKIKQFSQLSWNNDATKLAFYEETADTNALTSNYTIVVADLKNDAVKRLDSNLFPKGYTISRGSTALFSPTDAQVFFSIITSQKALEVSEFVQVWDASTIYDYPKQKEYDNKQHIQYLTMWDMLTNTLKRIEDEQFPEAFVLPRGRNVLKYSTSTYEPQFKESAPADFYIENLESGERSLVIEKHSTEPYSIQASESGQFLSYFSNGNWFIYDTKNRSAFNATSVLNSEFRNLQANYPGDEYAFESPGFTNDSKYLIVHDIFDVWLLATDGSAAKRITDGRKRNTRFTVEKSLYFKNAQTEAEFIRYDFDLSKEIIIRGIDDKKSRGYFVWSKSKGLRTVLLSASMLKGIQKASQSDIILYMDETSSTPPALKMLNMKNKKINTLFQSNQHNKKYENSRSVLLTYTKEDGEELQGILQYPSNYIAGKKYPMIVYIYERLSQNLHHYINPSFQNPIGFSAANYTFDGYFVLMPDITYKIGLPGESALDCVLAAVENVVSTGMVSEDKIGLIGHSFGGYEVGYILTKTKVFAAGVIGSGLSDLVKAALTMNFSDGRANTWRIEMQQYRMGISLFEDFEKYVANSPISSAATIATPVLNWAGKKDMAVNWEQGLELHLALRRLEKENIFLFYPNDGHILTNLESQLDLNKRIKEWFRVHMLN